VHFGATCELSFDCTAALTHYSSAVNYPVMLRKPINTITFDALKAASQGLFADSISDTLGRTIIDLSANRDDEAIRKAILAPVREAAYADYMANYIVNVDNPGTNPFENLVDYLKRL
jgi:hypothetical protein